MKLIGKFAKRSVLEDGVEYFQYFSGGESIWSVFPQESLEVSDHALSLLKEEGMPFDLISQREMEILKLSEDA